MTSVEWRGDLIVKILPEGRQAKLYAPFTVALDNGSTVITVPAGFETDFASVPRVFWRVVPPWGRYSWAAVVHDYLYYSGLFTRAQADKIFLILMEDLGVTWWKRQAMYRLVRAGAWKAWNDHRAQARIRGDE